MIEAVITVISCDRCITKVVVIRNENERDEYRRTWFDDGIVNFCPDCRIASPAKPMLQPNDDSQQFDVEKHF